jgi:hypothetical protein
MWIVAIVIDVVIAQHWIDQSSFCVAFLVVLANQPKLSKNI